jgi:enamine deaminase RidA (YjgF/YER057c/UK114 family)
VSAGKDTLSFGLPWESVYGYVQAVKSGELLFISGQLSHDERGNIVAPAPLDETGRISDFSNMEAQMRRTYRNAARVLRHFSTTADQIVAEVLYVLDMDAAFAVAGPVRKEFYGIDRPMVASTVLVTPRLAFPTQLIEVQFVIHI